jgi:uncharacterized protein YqjF (DUF2071 family)
MSFLKAEWRKLVLANYVVSEARLLPYLPAKTVLDTWNGQHYVSLVGFMFVNTKMLGFKIPFHVNFEEVNLRFYVKYNENGRWKRGVVFIKEIVPRLALSLVANSLYKEHYVTRNMKHQWTESEQTRQVQYSWLEGTDWQSIKVESSLESYDILEGSEAEFITEHYWGYTKAGKQKTFEYEVTHPTWQCYQVKSYEIAVDFAKVYGSTFAQLSETKPVSVLLAEGSEITVEGKRTI